jgi:hypothetical protein
MSDQVHDKITYRDFAAKITFFSFLDIEEFQQIDFKPERYRKELDALKTFKDITIESLAVFLVEHPRIILIFSRILRDQRFSNTQIAHFCFDLEVINSDDHAKLTDKFDLHYKSVDLFQTHVNKELHKLHDEGIIDKSEISSIDDTGKVILLKSAIQNFCANDEYLIRILPISEFKDVSLRTSQYLIENLWLDRILKTIDVEQYLLAKRTVRDTRGLHGNFGADKVEEILIRHGLRSIDEDLGKSQMLRQGSAHPNLRSSLNWNEISKKWTYVNERFIEGLIKPNDGKNKKFDFVLLQNGIPKIAIETNFYTTIGTKIGINIDEYIAVLNHIKANAPTINFLWITDGPSWLETNQRRKMVDTLIPTFGKHLMNYKLFDEYLRGLIEQ